MTTTAFVMKYGDTAPPLEMILQDGLGQPVDLTDATIELHVRRTGATAVLSMGGDIINAPAGLVRYAWPIPFPLEPGIYEAEWQATWTDDGTVETFPNNGYFIVQIVAQLA